jgi:hypothetical protein
VTTQKEYCIVLVETMESASLVALSALAIVPLVARIARIKNFSYPALIAFGVGYVVGAALGVGLGAIGIWEDVARMGTAAAAMQIVRMVARKHVAAA